MMGALEGGLSFQKGLGAVHSLSHALGGLQDLKLHHGTLNAILMPLVRALQRARRRREARPARGGDGAAGGRRPRGRARRRSTGGSACRRGSPPSA